MSFVKIISTNSLFAPFAKFIALEKKAPYGILHITPELVNTPTKQPYRIDIFIS